MGHLGAAGVPAAKAGGGLILLIVILVILFIVGFVVMKFVAKLARLDDFFPEIVFGEAKVSDIFGIAGGVIVIVSFFVILN